MGRRGIDGHFFCFFKIVVIANGRTVGYFTHTVNYATVVKHSFYKRRFALATVSHNRNVADALKICTHNKKSPLCITYILSVSWGVKVDCFGFSPFPKRELPQRTDNYNHYIIFFHIFQGGF